MEKVTLLLFFPVLILTACSNAEKNNERTEIQTGSEGNQAAMSAETGSTELCYATKTKAGSSAQDEHYNYEFVHFTIDGDKVRGSIRYYPYGTDGMEASLTGVLKESTKEINTQADILAEGELTQQSRSFTMLEDAVQMDYMNARQQPAKIPQVSCNTFQSMLDEYNAQIMKQNVNTTDRSRLAKIDALEDNFTQEELQQVKFMERPVDLDRNYQTNEYLLYVMDPMYCGTGGCNLFVINDKGETLSEISVVKLPVYTTSSTIEDMQNNKGVWKDLYVWSQGYRRLTPANGIYPANASSGTTVVEEQISLHPEMFVLLLDYIEEE